MKLYLISQRTNCGYDTYDSAVVAAEDDNDATLINPSEYYPNWDQEAQDWAGTSITGKRYYQGSYGSWTKPENVTANYIGEAKEGTERGVICASFNAG